MHTLLSIALTTIAHAQAPVHQDYTISDFPCATESMDVTIHRPLSQDGEVEGLWHDYFVGPTTGNSNEDEWRIVFAVPEWTDNPERIVVFSAGQQDFPNNAGVGGLKSAMTGQGLGYFTFGADGVSRQTSLNPCSVYGRWTRAVDDGVFADVPTRVLLIFNARFRMHDLASDLDLKEAAWQAALLQGMSAADLADVEEFAFVGASRGGVLTQRIAGNLYRDPVLPDETPIRWMGFDSVFQPSEEGSRPQRTRNPVNLSYRAREQDLSSWEWQLNGRLFEVAGGKFVPYSIDGYGMGLPFEERGLNMSYAQRWVDLTHPQIGQKTDSATAALTILPTMRWWHAVSREHVDDTWKVLWGGGSDGFRVVDSGRGYMTEVPDLLIGDFDGDGWDDLMRTGLLGLTWIPSSGGSFGADDVWATDPMSSLPRERYGVGDFDGDGRDDVFVVAGATWRIQHGQPSMMTMAGKQLLASSWTTAAVHPSAIPMSHLAFADVNGDGMDDVIEFTGTQLKAYRSNGTGFDPAIVMGAYPHTRTDAFVGDFDGDGRADFATVASVSGTSVTLELFSATGSSLSSVSQAYLARENDGDIEQRMAVADVDGDDRDDLLFFTGLKWRVAYGQNSGFSGTHEYLPVHPHSYHLSRDVHGVGDFDGDGADDVFISQ